MIVISHPEYLDGEIEAVYALFEAGLSSFHVRKNSFNGPYMDAITLNRENLIVYHGDPAHARKYRTGVHFKSGQPIATMKGRFTSAAAHSISELMEYDGRVDRILVSPVFDSVSKKDYKSAFNSEEFRYLFDRTKFHSEIVALGGIDKRHAPLAINMGFDDVALLGAVWNTFIEKGLNAMLAKYRSIHNAIVLHAS